MIQNDADSAWKDILDAYFKNFIDYCLPQLAAIIDWTKPCEALDKELQAITAGTGKRVLDKLIKVSLLDGHDQWVLCHIEVQGRKQKDFAQRMFEYSYRIYDKYKQSVISCAALTDSHREWRPNAYEMSFLNGEAYLGLKFLVIKLLDYENKMAELEASRNPFASIILIHLIAMKMKSKSPAQRKRMKFALTKRFFSQGLDEIQIGNFYKFLDSVLGLPEALEIEYTDEVRQLEEDQKMAYITSAERLGMKKGFEIGKKEGRQEGRQEGKLEVAKRLLAEGLPSFYVTKITDLPLKKIEELQQLHLNSTDIKEPV